MLLSVHTIAEVPEYLRTPWHMLALLSIYVLLVKQFGPRLMEHRKAYKLKGYIVLYNISQVLACLVIINEILDITNGRVLILWQCAVVSPTAERLNRSLNIAYFVFWLKISELTETIVFVLRKKQNQVSKLHVFHHCSTVTLYYLMLNVYYDLPILFPVFLNSNVHIVMYSYYLVAAIAEKGTLRYLATIKRSITVMQMIQFVFILVQQVYITCYCNFPIGCFLYYFLVICIMFYGFYDFYKKSYKQRSMRQRGSAQLPD